MYSRKSDYNNIYMTDILNVIAKNLTRFFAVTFFKLFKTFLIKKIHTNQAKSDFKHKTFFFHQLLQI